jgi:N-acetylmuramoyl-L-alanine amidase
LKGKNVNKIFSPNFNERPDDAIIDLLVMHYTGMKTGAEALTRMCDHNSQVSAHYMVDLDGTVISLVPEDKRAWHAGISCWRGIASLNDTSIGIEIVNPGHEFGYDKFTDEQMQSVISLSQEIISRYRIEAVNVVGHSDIAPSRKQDPGELFNWQLLAKNGVGIWPDVKTVKNPDRILVHPGKEGVDVGRVQKMLSDFGYHIRVDGYYGSKTEDVIRAFKRRFATETLNISWDNLAEARIKKLLEIIGKL